MWDCKFLSILLLTFCMHKDAVGFPQPSEELLKDVILDKDNKNVVDDIAQFVVHKVEEVTQAVGATEVLNEAKLQEYVTSALSKSQEWLSQRMSNLYNRIRDRVSQWWEGVQTKGEVPTFSKEELSTEVKKEVLKKVLTKIEEELKSKKITGIDEKHVQSFVFSVIKKVFAGLFGDPVQYEGNLGSFSILL